MSLDHYNFPKQLLVLWEKGVEDYKQGGRHPGAYLHAKDQQFLTVIGANQQDLFDFTEDFVCGGDPDFATFLSVQIIRFNYLKVVQAGELSNTIKPRDEFPAKEDAFEGIEWLPRIIEKARCKLKGELPDDLMYGCGGDRAFLTKHNLHPAEFLQLVWTYMDSPEAVAQYLRDNSPALR